MKIEVQIDKNEMVGFLKKCCHAIEFNKPLPSPMYSLGKSYLEREAAYLWSDMLLKFLAEEYECPQAKMLFKGFGNWEETTEKHSPKE